jgi:hypothetical protein
MRGLPDLKIFRFREAGAMITEAGTTTLDDAHSATSWKAILAGTTVAIALTLLVVTFGVGVGFSVVSPWADQGVSSTTFTIAAGVFLIVVAMIPSTIGGYLAGRLRSRWQAVHEHERYFRDSAHGLVVWALATVVIAGFLGGPITRILSGAGAAAAVASAGKSAPADVYVDQLLRSDPAQGSPATATPTTPSTPAVTGGQSAAGNRAEISRILAPSMIKGGSVSDPDKAYLAKVVAARSGIPQAQAEQRVNQVITEAKSAADAARKSAAKFSLWLVASMLAGALAASLAAIEGGSLRNREWYLDK